MCSQGLATTKRRSPITTKPDFRFCEHAKIRRAQRAISVQDVDYVLIHGTVINCAGAVFYVLRRIDIPVEDLKAKERLIGLTVLFDRKDKIILTTYRNPEVLKRIRRKLKWDRRCRTQLGFVGFGD